MEPHMLRLCCRVVLSSSIFLTTLAPLTRAADDPPPLSPNAEDLKHAVGLSRAFQAAARAVRPAVVNIQVEMKPEPVAKNQKMPDLFHEFFGDTPDNGAHPKRRKKKDAPNAPNT